MSGRYRNYDEQEEIEKLWKENNRLLSKLIDELNELRAKVDELKMKER